MRVLIVTPIFPPDIGGPATYVPRLATGLVARGSKVTVLTLSERIDLDDSGYSFRVARTPRSMFRPLRWLRFVATAARLARDADVCFVTGPAIEAILAQFVVPRPEVQKIVGDFAWEWATARRWTSDDFESFQQRRYGLRVEWLKRVQRWWLSRADHVIVPSRYLARWVREQGVSCSKITVIPNEVTLPPSLLPVPPPLPSAVNLVTAGRLIAAKRHAGIIDAVARLEGVGLVIVGDGPERTALERRAAERGMTARVCFAGRRSAEETLALVAGCDAFVLNSTYEGYPHVLVEAAALGLPAVATAVGGTPEVAERYPNITLVRPDDPVALRIALEATVAGIRAGRRRKLDETSARSDGSSMLEQTEWVLRGSMVTK
jgi:glycosyltransferase involved in cell wall biosynthesis